MICSYFLSVVRSTLERSLRPRRQPYRSGSPPPFGGRWLCAGAPLSEVRGRGFVEGSVWRGCGEECGDETASIGREDCPGVRVMI